MIDKCAWMAVAEALEVAMTAPGMAQCTCRDPGTGLPCGKCRYCRLEAAEVQLQAIIRQTFIISRLLWAKRLTRCGSPASNDLLGWLHVGDKDRETASPGLLPVEGEFLTPRALLEALEALGFRWQDSEE